MKKLTRILSVVVIIALLVVLSVSLFACKKYVQQTDTGVVFTVDEHIMKDVEGKHLIDYLNALQDKGELTFSAPQSTYGSFLEEVNGIKADATKGEYWFIYSDDEENTTAAWGEYEYEGKKYYSTNFGLDDQPLKAGATYILMVSTYAS